MAILLNPECRDDNHAKCPNQGLDEYEDCGEMTYCPCFCHEGNAKCGHPHEVSGLAYLGACLMGKDHEGPHRFKGPIAGTVISITVGKGRGGE